MANRADHHPPHLSGGEQQRLAITLALRLRPAILLPDGPTGNLAPAPRRHIMDLIHGVNERTGVTVLLVTHDPVLAACAQRVLRMVDGRLRQEMSLDRNPLDAAPAALH